MCMLRVIVLRSEIEFIVGEAEVWLAWSLTETSWQMNSVAQFRLLYTAVLGFVAVRVNPKYVW